MEDIAKQRLIELYKTADRLKEHRPWEFLMPYHVMEIFPIGHNEAYYVRPYHKDGEGLGVCIYEGNNAYANHLEWLKAEEEDPLFDFFKKDQIDCCFIDNSAMFPEEKKLLKELGIKYRGKGSWTCFRMLKPGYLPIVLNEKYIQVIELLISVLEQYEIAIFQLKCGLVDVSLRKGQTIQRIYNEDKKQWITNVAIRNTPSKKYENELYNNEIIVQKIKRSKRTNHQIAVDTGYLLIPAVYDNGDKVFPKVLAFTELTQNMPVQKCILEKIDHKYLVEKIFEILTQVFLEVGIPSKIIVKDSYIESILLDLCNKIKVAVEVNPKLDIIQRSISDMLHELDKKI